MSWSVPFIVYRVSSTSGTLVEVYRAQDLQKANYWLSYIGEPDDVLCRTPAHPRHSPTVPHVEYVSHKSAGGKVVRNEEEWRKSLARYNHTPAMPEAEAAPPASE